MHKKSTGLANVIQKFFLQVAPFRTSGRVEYICPNTALDFFKLAYKITKKPGKSWKLD